MVKGILVLMFAAFVLAGSPSLAEEASAAAPLFLSLPASSCAMTSSAQTNLASLPKFLPDPQEQVIVCGTCGEVACDFKRAYGGCTTSEGTPGVCEPGPFCSGTNNVECYCH